MTMQAQITHPGQGAHIQSPASNGGTLSSQMQTVRLRRSKLTSVEHRLDANLALALSVLSSLRTRFKQANQYMENEASAHDCKKPFHVVGHINILESLRRFIFIGRARVER